MYTYRRRRPCRRYWGNHNGTGDKRKDRTISGPSYFFITLVWRKYRRNARITGKSDTEYGGILQ
jgi:hypothetical protein